MIMAMRDPPSCGSFGMGEHVEQEEELASLMRGQPRSEPAQRATVMLGAD